jgi:transcription initiation factor TFIID subunit 7
VEQEVERLLDEDAMATEVKYGECFPSRWHIICSFLCAEVLENVNPDLSDSEFIEQEVPLDAPTPAISDLGEGMGGDLGEGDEDEGAEGNESEPEQEGDIDEELAAELDMALGDEDEGAADEEEEEEDESEEDDDDDEDDDEAEARHLLSEEIRDLEAAVAKKQNEIAASLNPLIRVCSCLRSAYIASNRWNTVETIRGCLEEADGGLGNEAVTTRRDERETTSEERRDSARRRRF